MSGMQVEIIIPVHNQFNLTKRCIESIIKNTPETTNWHVTIVDDCSTDNTRANLRKLIAGKKNRFKIAWNQTRQGFTKTCQKGVANTSMGCRFYVFLNSDVEILTDDWLAKMMKPLLENDNLAIVGPLSNNATLQSVPSSCPKDNTENSPPPGFSKNDIAHIISENCRNTIQPFIMIHGFCFMIKASAYYDVGGFDEVNFPHHGSEDDLCLKLARKGHIGAVVDNVYLWHEKNASYGEERAELVKVSAVKLREIHGKFLSDAIQGCKKTPLVTHIREALRISFVSKDKRPPTPVIPKAEEVITIPKVHDMIVAERIGIGVCSYRRPAQTARIIKGILANVTTPHHLIVGIDDAEDRQTVDVCQTLNVQYYAATNKGNSVNRNRLMKILYDRGCDYIFLLEDDIEVLANFVIPYVEIMKNTNIPIMCGLHPALVENKDKESQFKIEREEQIGQYIQQWPSGNSNIFIVLHRSALEKFGYIDTIAYRNLYARTTGKWLDKIRKRNKSPFHAWPDVKEGRACYLYRTDVEGGMTDLRKREELKRFREFDLLHSGKRELVVVNYPEEAIVIR